MDKAPKKVLLVEDDIITRMNIANNLRELGCEVKEAGSLKDACELIANNVFDILITDTSIGSVTDESGVEIAKIFREKFPDAKIIAVSNHSRECWNSSNCDLFVYKIYLNTKKGLARRLAEVGIVGE